jgi:hypothetical protein
MSGTEMIEVDRPYLEALEAVAYDQFEGDISRDEYLEARRMVKRRLPVTR